MIIVNTNKTPSEIMRISQTVARPSFELVSGFSFAGSGIGSGFGSSFGSGIGSGFGLGVGSGFGFGVGSGSG